MDSWISRWLIALGHLSLRRPWAILLITAALTAWAGKSLTTLKLSADVLDLVPKGMSSAETLRILVEKTSIESVILAISGRGEEDLQTRIDLALSLQNHLASLATVREVRSAFGSSESLDDTTMALLFLRREPEQIKTLPQQLTAHAIDARVRQNLAHLVSPVGIVTDSIIREDPLGLVTPALERLHRLRGQLQVSMSDDVLITADGTYVLLFVLPEGSSANIGFSKTFLEEITERTRATMFEAGIRGTVGIGPPAPGTTSIHVGITGPAATLVDYRNILASDLGRVSTVALMTVLLLFLLAFRRLEGLIIAGVPLVVGVVWTLGVTALLYESINILTAGAVPILCGLAVDFTIHLYNRYLEESQRGRGAEAMVAIANGETGVAIVATAATTTWGCLALGMAVQPGVRMLGFVCAIGMVLSLVASLLLVPALVALVGVSPGFLEGHGVRKGFGLRSIVAAAIRRPWLFIVAGLLLGIVLAAFGVRLRVDEGFRGPHGAPSKQLMIAVSQRIGTLMEMTAVSVVGSSADKALVDASKISDALVSTLQASGGPIAAVFGSSDVMPPEPRQMDVLEALNRLRDDGAIDPDRVQAEVLAAMDRHGFRIGDELRQAAATVAYLLSLDRPVTLEEARNSALGPLLRDLLVEKDDGNVLALVAVYPRVGVTTQEFIPILEHAVKESGANAEVVGARALGHAMKPIVFRDVIVCSLIGILGVLLILFVTFRGSLVATITTLVPVVVGVAAGIGVMTLFAIDFNPGSISMIPLLLGIGIDDGIHIVHRFLGRSGERLVDSVSYTARGVVMTSLTNIAAFGSMMFAAHQSLFSSGIFVAIGVGAMLVASVTFVPALLEVSIRRRRATGKEPYSGVSEF